MKTLKDLKERYNTALANNEEEFTIDGYEFLTSYAKYLIEYCDLRKIPNEKPLKSFLIKND